MLREAWASRWIILNDKRLSEHFPLQGQVHDPWPLRELCLERQEERVCLSVEEAGSDKLRDQTVVCLPAQLTVLHPVPLSLALAYTPSIIYQTY